MQIIRGFFLTKKNKITFLLFLLLKRATRSFIKSDSILCLKKVKRAIRSFCFSPSSVKSERANSQPFYFWASVYVEIQVHNWEKKKFQIFFKIMIIQSTYLYKKLSLPSPLPSLARDNVMTIARWKYFLVCTSAAGTKHCRWRICPLEWVDFIFFHEFWKACDFARL